MRGGRLFSSVSGNVVQFGKIIRRELHVLEELAELLPQVAEAVERSTKLETK